MHVLSGRTGDAGRGEPDGGGARSRYRRRAAVSRSSAPSAPGSIVLIEPLCPEAAPGYHLGTLDAARSLIEEIDHPRLKILFDCFHVRHVEGDVIAPFERHAAHVAHVQIASFPERAEPAAGGIDYASVLPAMRAAGYAGPIGCEYRQQGSDAADRAWREGVSPPRH